MQKQRPMSQAAREAQELQSLQAAATQAELSRRFETYISTPFTQKALPLFATSYSAVAGAFKSVKTGGVYAWKKFWDVRKMANAEITKEQHLKELVDALGTEPTRWTIFQKHYFSWAPSIRKPAVVFLALYRAFGKGSKSSAVMTIGPEVYRHRDAITSLPAAYQKQWYKHRARFVAAHLLATGAALWMLYSYLYQKLEAEEGLPELEPEEALLELESIFNATNISSPFNLSMCPIENVSADKEVLNNTLEQVLDNSKALMLFYLPMFSASFWERQVCLPMSFPEDAPEEQVVKEAVQAPERASEKSAESLEKLVEAAVEKIMRYSTKDTAKPASDSLGVAHGLSWAKGLVGSGLLAVKNGVVSVPGVIKNGVVSTPGVIKKGALSTPGAIISGAVWLGKKGYWLGETALPWVWTLFIEKSAMTAVIASPIALVASLPEYCRKKPTKTERVEQQVAELESAKTAYKAGAPKVKTYHTPASIKLIEFQNKQRDQKLKAVTQQLQSAPTIIRLMGAEISKKRVASVVEMKEAELAPVVLKECERLSTTKGIEEPVVKLKEALRAGDALDEKATKKFRQSFKQNGLFSQEQVANVLGIKKEALGALKREQRLARASGIRLQTNRVGT